VDGQSILLASGIGSGWILAGYFVRLVYRGDLVPKTTVDGMRSDHTRELEDSNHDRDEWRTAHRLSEVARVEEREHNAALVEDIAKPVKEFLQAFRSKAAARREGDPT
jgi:hypothetical protein